MATEDEVRNASTQFYAALNRMLNGDAQPLSDIWSHGQAVTTMHPIGGRQVGWNEVRESWEQVAQGASDGKVELKDQLIRVLGDVAYEVGVECPARRRESRGPDSGDEHLSARSWSVEDDASSRGFSPSDVGNS
jgi:ketosteroid isomerase-like protein